MLAYIYPLIFDNYILQTNSMLFTFYKREKKSLFSINLWKKNPDLGGVVFSNV